MVVNIELYCCHGLANIAYLYEFSRSRGSVA